MKAALCICGSGNGCMEAGVAFDLHSLSFAAKDRRSQGDAINILQDLTEFGSLKTVELEIGFCLIGGSHSADRLSKSWMIQQHDE
ncbi:hypothetical protein CEXT_573411 [Caerostris extrusa]|uniref:Uncharacterized protein n=1 Tax=Caerostris extrusa TaxID=172846 RepID=A0AAV4XS71_CAEEX|nr:hypothetical protein CEXT_573411 [Caerostris extrusa]